MTPDVRRSSAILVIACASLLLSKPALAQGPDPVATNLVSKQKIVFVVDANGTEFVGRLVRLESSSLTISTFEGEQSFERDRILAVYRRGDSVASGAKIGAVVGAIFGAWLTKEWGCGALLTGYEPCPARTYVGSMAVMGGMGAGVGIGIDALVHGRTRIYPTTTGGFWPALRLVPDASLRRTGVVVSAQW